MDADETTMIGEASAAADAWLARLDAGELEASWREGASLFRQTVTPEQWAEAQGRIVSVLGGPLERWLRDSEHLTSVPDGPDGHYVLLRYETRFERREEALETVVTILDTDGRWRVGGYFVQ